ncbi:tyrosine-protein kinase RYK-like isoform X2 [Uloborus diversus]|uniref:tyrosine-protein kinase RYK-like isoform X2 n=1 Tax=Uloborus diversus TaxID=327109 RepID=UPI002409A358|nr:tyrosine-protein kinase RYK-like isoform X2 [Uloborus diversus]
MVPITLLQVLLHLTFVLMRGVAASFNLYIRPPEVKRLLGLNAELRYVNNGTVNDYALGFVVMVPDHISELHFTWQSLRPNPIPYSISFSVSDPDALSAPQLNISRTGSIPTKEEVFRLVLQCTGRVNAEVDVFMNINITMVPPSNITHLVLKRKKICLKDDGSNGTLMIDAMVATGSSLYIGVGCACAVVVLITIGAVTMYLRTMKARRTDVIHYGGSSPALSTTTQGHTFLRPDTPNHASSAGSYSSFKRLTPITTTTTSVQVNETKRMDIAEQISEIRIDRHKILMQEKLQEGTFGQIYHAIVTDDNIIAMYGLHTTVKTVKDQASPIQVSLLTAEGMMMLGMNHKCILPLVGLCTDDPHHPMLIYPYMNQGNLKKFLHRCMLAAEGHCRALTTQNRVGMALQIIQAVAYLHKRKIIHRDIATRNCVVDDALQVKLTDNALARDLFPTDYHCLGDNENRPIKWLAIESLLKKEFSWASDVWAFGVTMWELMTLGQQPYIEIDPFEMHLYLRDGYRLNPPTNCPEELYTVMAFCWEAVPDDRPSVTHLMGCLQDFYTALGRFI